MLAIRRLLGAAGPMAESRLLLRTIPACAFGSHSQALVQQKMQEYLIFLRYLNNDNVKIIEPPVYTNNIIYYNRRRDFDLKNTININIAKGLFGLGVAYLTFT